VGYDRSPVVVGSKGVYYVGDGGTGSFSSSNLTLQVSTETNIDGLFSDLGNGHQWTFGTSSSTWLQADGNGELSPGTMLTHLIPLVADADGNLARGDASRHVVALSTALNPYWNEYPLPMLFLSMGELVFTSSFKAPSAFAGAFPPGPCSLRRTTADKNLVDLTQTVRQLFRQGSYKNERNDLP